MDVAGLVKMVEKPSVALAVMQKTDPNLYKRVAAAQTKELTGMIATGNFTLLQLSPLTTAIKTSSFPKEGQEQVIQCIGTACESTAGMAAVPKGFQNWESFCGFLPENVWSEGDFGSNVLGFVIDAGLRNPTGVRSEHFRVTCSCL